MDKKIVSITGPSTSGKSTLLKFLHHTLGSKSVILPQATLRSYRSDDMPEHFRYLNSESFNTADFWVKSPKYGILNADVEKFIQNPFATTAICVNGPEEILNAKTSRLETRNIMLRLSSDPEEEIAQAAERVSSCFDGEELTSRVDSTKKLIKQYFFSDSFVRNHIDLILEHGTPCREWIGALEALLDEVMPGGSATDFQEIITKSDKSRHITTSSENVADNPREHYILISTEDETHNVKGGIGTYTALMAKALSEMPGVRVHWITESPIDKKFEEVGKVHRVYLNRFENGNKMDLSAFSEKIQNKVLSLMQEIQGNQPQAQIFIEAPEWEGHMHKMFSVVAADNRVITITRLHTPLVVTGNLNGMDLDQPELQQQMLRERSQILNSDVVSSPTEYVLNETKEHLLKNSSDEITNRTTIIPNPVDVDAFKAATTRSNAIEKINSQLDFGVDGDAFNVFFLGSLEERKGTHIAVEVIRKFAPEFRDAQFYFVGHFLDSDDCQITSNNKLRPSQLIGKIDSEIASRVHFTGYIPHEHMPEIIAAGDAFPVLYLGDNFPGVIAEIGLSQRPLIAYMRGGIPEMVKDQHGIPLCYPITDDEIHGATMTCCNHLRSIYLNRNMEFAREKALQQMLVSKFSPRHVAQMAISQYRNTMRSKSNSDNLIYKFKQNQRQLLG